jgi:hypothetical protein
MREKTSAREYLAEHLDRMKIDERLDIEGHIFRRAYSWGWPTIYNTPFEAFLSSRIGSAWGCWGVYHRGDKDVYVVSRHKEGKKRVYVDPDRAHLFKRMPDGSLEHVDACKSGMESRTAGSHRNADDAASQE